MIRKFEKEYRWLSNFYPCTLRFRGQRFESVEYAYMSAKSDDKAWKQTKVGDNHLGRLIMEIREELKAAVGSLPKEKN